MPMLPRTLISMGAAVLAVVALVLLGVPLTSLSGGLLGFVVSFGVSTYLAQRTSP